MRQSSTVVSRLALVAMVFAGIARTGSLSAREVVRATAPVDANQIMSFCSAPAEDRL